jgi:hypothetical protein
MYKMIFPLWHIGISFVYTLLGGIDGQINFTARMQIEKTHMCIYRCKYAMGTLRAHESNNGGVA